MNAAQWLADGKQPLIGRLFSIVFRFDGVRLELGHVGKQFRS
jgi:hypothetical protein